MNRMGVDGVNQAEPFLTGQLEGVHHIDSVAIREIKPPDRTGGILMLKLHPAFGLCLGVEEFTLACIKARLVGDRV